MAMIFKTTLAAAMLLCAQLGLSYANHESSKQPPLWTPLDEPERFAAMDTPGGMVTVPAGSFLMGSDLKVDRAAGPQELPQHEVYVDAFEMDIYEVSNVDYLRFVLATGVNWPQFWRERPFPEKAALHPVINVSWHDAEAYCNGPASGYRQKRNGKRRRAEKTGVCFPGAMSRLAGSKAILRIPVPNGDLNIHRWRM